MTKRGFLSSMFTLLFTLVFTLGLSSTSWAADAEKETLAPQVVNPQVLMETNYGTIIMELDIHKAPKTVANFLNYVNKGFYDGTIFHRVISNFMIQGGGFTPDMRKKTTLAPIENEADNGLRNRIGTVAMARTSDPHSATAQFFINVSQNTFLDFREKTPRAYGYAVFGRVIQGMKVVNKIRSVRTGFKNGMKDVPVNTVSIIKVRQIR